MHNSTHADVMQLCGDRPWLDDTGRGQDDLQVHLSAHMQSLGLLP